MNFLCDKCKQKYHVADDKLRGRAVTRFRCKKCDNVIELQAPATPENEAPSASSMPASVVSVRPATGAMPAARTTARPRPLTSSGPAFGALRGPTGAATGAKGPTTGFGADASRGASASPAMSASENGWYAGIRDLPVGPLTRKELATRVHAGEVTPETLVWREGLDDWRPLRNIAELGDLLRPAAPPKAEEEPTRRPPAPRSAQVVPIGASRSAMSRPSIAEDDDDEATRVAGMDPALAGLVARTMPLSDRPAERPRSVPPIAEKPPVTAPASTVARAPASPVARAPSVPPAAEKRPPAPPAAARSASLRPPPPTAKLAAKPVERVSEPPVPSLEEMFSDVPALVGASTVVAGPPSAAAPARHSEPEMAVAPAVLATASPKPGIDALAATLAQAPAVDDDLPEDLFAKPVAAMRSTPPVTAPVFAPTASTPPISAPLVMPQPLAMPTASQPLAAPVTLTPSQRGLPASTWVLLAGVLVVGIGGGIYIGRVNHPQQLQVLPTPRPVHIADAAPPSAPLPALVADASALTADAAVLDDDAVELTADAPAEPSRETPHEHGHADHGDRGAHAPVGLSPAELARLAAETRNAASGPQLTGPVGNTQPRDTPPQPNAPSSPSQSPAQRGNAIMRNFENSRVVGTCWQATLRQNPALRSTGVTIDVGVDGRGRFTSVNVDGSPDPRFTTCLRSRLGSIAPIAPGEAMDARTSVTLTVAN